MQRELGIYIDHMCKDFERFIKNISEAGFGYICTQDSIDYLNFSKEDRIKRIFETKEIGEKYGLKFLAHHSCPILLPSLDVKESVNYLKNFIDELKNWGLSFYVIHARSIKNKAKPWKIIENIGKERFDKISVEVLKDVCDYAYKYNISIALENLPYPYVNRVKYILEIIEKVERENLGICFDSGHSNISTESVYEEIEKSGTKLFTTHFHDNLGNKNKVDIDDENISRYDLHLVPGLGTINWIEINRILDKIGYRYPVVFEGIKGIEKEKDLLEITVKLWRSFEKLVKEVKDD